MVRFAKYIYNTPSESFDGTKCCLPTREGGAWVYKDFFGRQLDEEGVENLKTEFYKLEGWEESTGYPRRATLEQLGLADVAEVLAVRDKLA